MTSTPVVEFNFGMGFDESLHEELLDGRYAFAAMQNVRQGHFGGAEKREGYSAIPTDIVGGGNISAGYRMFSSHGQLCVIDGTYLYTYAPTIQKWVKRSRVPEATYRRLPSPTLGSTISAVEDTAVVNGYVVTVACAYDSDAANFYAYAWILDPTSGVIVRGPDLITSAAVVSIDSVRIASYGLYAIVFIADVANDAIRAWYSDLSTNPASGWLSIGSFTTINNSSSVSAWDVANVSTGDRVAIAFTNLSGGTSRITVKTLNISGPITSVDIATSSVAPLCGSIGLSDGGEVIWLAWKDHTNHVVKAMGLDPTALTATYAAATVISSSFTQTSIYVESVNSGHAVVWAGGLIDSSSNFGVFIQAIKNSSGTVATDGSLNTVGGALMESRPFQRSGRWYGHVSSPNQDDFELVDMTPDTTTGQIYLRPVVHATVRGDTLTTTQKRGRTAVVSATQSAYTAQKKGENGGTITDLLVYDFADVDRWRPAKLASGTFLGGGILSIFDGLRIFESAFLAAPTTPGVAAVSGSLTFVNGRQYVAIYEEVDAAGNRHISGVSAVSAYTGAQTSQKINVTAAPLSITSRGSLAGTASHSLRLVVYGTLDSAGGLTEGAGPYYRVGSVENTPTTGALTVTDTLSDALLATQELLYGTGNLPATNGSSQDHRAPPGMKLITSYNGMLVGLEGANLWFSSQPIDGEGQWFSPVFTRVVDADATGLTVQDGEAIIFTRDGALTITGDPPSDNAAVGGLDVPRRFPLRNGCINAASIATCDMGTFYLSDRGIELFGRAQLGDYAGSQVRDSLASFPQVMAATIDTIKGLVLVSLSASLSNGAASGNGCDLVFDLNVNKWLSKDVKHGSADNQPSQDAGMVQYNGPSSTPVYAWLAANGVVYLRRSDGSSYDGTTWTVQSATTGWVRIAGLQGEQLLDQLGLLTQRFTNHDLTIALAFDYSDTFSSSVTISSAKIAALGREWINREIAHTTSQAVRVKLTDVSEAGAGGDTYPGKGAAWLALTFSGAPHQGIRRFSPAERGA